MRVTVPHGRLDVTELGPADGAVVVLLHGFPQTPHCWRHIAPMLAEEGLRVLVPTLRGAAPDLRPADDAAYALARTVADLQAVLVAAAVEDAVVVGHDWGGLVAWAAASVLPARVRAVLAISTPHPRVLAEAVRDDADQQARSSYVERLSAPDAATTLLADDAAVLRAVLAGCGAEDDYVRLLSAPGLLHSFLGLYRALSWTELGAVGPPVVPVTYLYGDGDEVFGAQAVGRTTELATRSVRVRAGGHWLPEQRPEVVLQEVRSLLAPGHPVQADREQDQDEGGADTRR